MSSSPVVKAYLTYWSQLEVHDGILYRRKPMEDGSVSKLQVLVPEKLREDFLMLAHSGFGGGHLGSGRTAKAVQDRAYWIGWGADVRRYCQRCDICARYRRGAAPKQGTLQAMTTGGPWERIGVDVTGPHPKSSRGHVHILTVMDYFTKWADAFPIRNQEASTVAKVLVERVFAYFGAPLQILTDLGSNFQSDLFTELLRRLEIDQARTTPYKPSANGLIERFHRTLNSILGKVVNRAQKDWDEWIPYALAAYRATVHEATNFSPNRMMLGRENRLPIDLVYGAPEAGPLYESSDDFVARRQELFRECHRIVRDKLQRSAERQKRRYDLRVKERQFNLGDMVYYFYPRRRAGLSPKWQRFYEGPYDVVERLGPVTYRIRKSPRSNPLVVYVDKLKACGLAGGDSVASGATQPTDPVSASHRGGRDLTPPGAPEDTVASGRARREIRLPLRYRISRVLVDTEKMHRCRACGEEFPTYVWLRSHVKKSHRQSALTSKTQGPAKFSPASSPEEPQITELRRAIVNEQFQVFRRNLALATDRLQQWHKQDSSTLKTATVDLTNRLRGTAPGAAMSKENLTAMVVAAKVFAKSPPSIPPATEPPDTADDHVELPPVFSPPLPHPPSVSCINCCGPPTKPKFVPRGVAVRRKRTTNTVERKVVRRDPPATPTDDELGEEPDIHIN